MPRVASTDDLPYIRRRSPMRLHSVRWAHLSNLVALALIVMLVGCQQAPPSSSRAGGSGGSAAAPSQGTPKRLTAVIMGDPPHFEERWNPNLGSVPGLDVMIDMMNA